MIQGIIEILTENSGVTDLVGLNLAGDKYKIFPVVCPQQETQPYVIAFKNSTNPVQCKGSFGGYDEVNFSLLHYGQNYITVDQMHEATRSALDGLGFVTDSNIVLDQIRFITDVDLFDNSAQLYVRRSDYIAVVKN